jgi:hypothetical protein
MHLGVHLRTAAVKGMDLVLKNGSIHTTGCIIDTCVHAVCKLLGHLGVSPEYGHGVTGFPEYLQRRIDELKEQLPQNLETIALFEQMQMCKFDRQIGSRYFVTARNAGRIIYIREMALAYLEEIHLVKKLNKLEDAVMKYLKNDDVNAQLKVDALLFDKIYADLMTLLKSNTMSKSLLDMNQHYLELKQFLELLKEDPAILLDIDTIVFPSEKNLYSDCDTNHRQTSKYRPVYKRLYESDTYDDKVKALVQGAASEMLKTIEKYKADQLPGGRLWEPSSHVRELCTNIPSTNDKCESLLGLNDWIHRRNPNFSQQTVSTLCQTARNKTSDWLNEQPRSLQHKIIQVAKKEANTRHSCLAYKASQPR